MDPENIAWDAQKAMKMNIFIIPYSTVELTKVSLPLRSLCDARK